MYCSNCGTQIPDDSTFCSHCGNNVNPGSSRSQNDNYSERVVYREVSESSLPEKYKPLSAWAYFGYGLLFAIPIVGLICLIVFSFNDKNINRRNYARSFWCFILVAVILYIILMLAGISLFKALDGYNYNYSRYW